MNCDPKDSGRGYDPDRYMFETDDFTSTARGLDEDEVITPSVNSDPPEKPSGCYDPDKYIVG